MDENTDDWLARVNKPKGNLAVALEMAAAGLPVFPAAVAFNATKQSWEKQPLVKGWQTEASCVEVTLRAWWRQFPKAVPGIELGRAGLIMLDPDRHNGGEDGVENFRHLVEQHDPLPEHPITYTAGGGEHHYFKQPNGEPFTNAEGDLKGRSINVRGKGGWAVAPGAVRPDGKRWEPSNLAQAFRDDTIPFLTGWLGDKIRPPRRHTATSPVRPESDDQDRVEAALRYIPNDDRDTWLGIGAALHETGWGCARSLWDAWSATSSKFDHAGQEKAWRSFDRPYNGPRKTIASLFELAFKNGYGAEPRARPRANGQAGEQQTAGPKLTLVASNPALMKPAAMSVEEWLKREIEEADCILGDWLTTTSRVLLTAPTGLGKTMFVFGLAMGAGTAKGFLSWRGRRISRVLIIDGEMSIRLLKKRIAGEAARTGAPLTSVYFLSHEDVENFAPLNTPEGQKYIDQEIERLGGVDLIVFDNIMSLIAGDPKENEPLRQVLPWAKSLTKRHIGQIWVHHTGHDESRSYGDKAREWQMDTTIHLERVERPDTDVSFDLQFRKAREREPETRHDFEDFRIALVDDQWIWERTKGGGHKDKVSGLTAKFLDALKAAIAADGGHYGRQSVTLDAWRAECVKRSLIDKEAKPDAARSLFSRHRLALIAANQIVCNETEAWITP